MLQTGIGFEGWHKKWPEFYYAYVAEVPSDPLHKAGSTDETLHMQGIFGEWQRAQ